MEEDNQMQHMPQGDAQGIEKQNPATAAEAVSDTASQEAGTPHSDESAQPVAEVSVAVATEQPATEEPVAATAENNDEGEQAPALEEPNTDYSGLSREEMVEAMKSLMLEHVSHVRNRAARLKELFGALNREVLKNDYEAFLADGGDKATYEDHNDAVANAFYEVYNRYRDLRQQWNDEQEAEKQRNLTQKQELVEAMRQLAENEEESTLKAMYDRFNELQEKWKTIGEVPRTEANDLWQNYRHWVDQFFAKVKLEKESMMEDMRRNLEEKLKLCEQAEEQILNENDGKAFHILQGLRDQWKAIGPVPPEQNDSIWQRFQSAAEQISTHHQEVLAQRREELGKNLLAKQALVDKVNELTTAERPTSYNGWKALTDQLDELMAIWKTIGPVPRENNDTIWRAFKDKIDDLYKEKKAYFASMHETQSKNMAKKVDLCEKAEIIAQRDDFKEATKELLNLQAQWKAIGNVKHSDGEKLWQRFRAACDTFFNRKSERYQEMHGDEEENLKKKEALIEELKAMTFDDDKQKNMDKLKDIQRRWTDVGFVPRKDKDRVQHTFREAINGIFDQLKLTAREAEETAFKERVQRHANDIRFTRNEHDNLQNKIDRLRNDIHTRENNLGFLSSSKQANLLKEEFDRKLQNARQELALLEAKLKILNAAPKDAATAANNDNVKTEETAVHRTEE